WQRGAPLKRCCSPGLGEQLRARCLVQIEQGLQVPLQVIELRRRREAVPARLRTPRYHGSASAGAQALRRSAASAVTPVRDIDGMNTELEDETSDPRVWKKSGWIARVIKNENDECWAVSMTRMGDAEPVLVSPWTMGRDKVNPKPLDHSGFATLLKGARDVLRRHEDALRARLHRSITC